MKRILILTAVVLVVSMVCSHNTNQQIGLDCDASPIANARNCAPLLGGYAPSRISHSASYRLTNDSTCEKMVRPSDKPSSERQKWMDRTRAINTMVGTDYAVTSSPARYGKGSEEHGQTLPAVLEPHGQTFWTPQTQDTEQKCVAPYYYRDSLFQGFRASHWLVGGCTQDYGSFTLMPMMGHLRLKATQRATPFAHEDEVSHPYYYAVKLPKEHLLTEMTGRSRSAIFRFIPDQSGEMHIVVHPNSDEGEGFVTVDSAGNRIWGYNPVHRIYQGWGEKAGFSGWFVVQFQRPFKAYGVKDSVAFVTFDARAGDTVLAKAACSFNDLVGAMENMKEISGWDFPGTQLALDSIWQRRLQTIEVESDDENSINRFYGALYRASFLPRVISDRDGHAPQFGKGEHTGLDDKVCWFPTEKGITAQTYSDFSMWDIFRAQLPLLNLIAPDRVEQMMQSLTTMYTQGSWMPIFPCWNSYTSAMIGDHAASVIADAYVKGNRGFDVSVAYRGLRKNAFNSPKTFAEYQNGMGRRALKSYLHYGYIPLEDSVMEAFHTHEQVSRTLEYAYDDFCVAQLAKTLGETDDYAALMKRAQNWRNVINPHTGWADGRHEDGRWLGNRDFTSRVPFITEGAVVHYSFFVPHDVYGLMEAMGGRERFIEKLDTLSGLHHDDRMSQDQSGFYWHGNEPCHHIPYLYAWAGEPWKTQEWVHRIRQTEYLDVPGGLSGNDDAGQMSAWYVFSALGFYPVCPATPYYILGTPMFEKARIGHLIIEAEGVSEENFYIQSATWNGRPYTKTYITHNMITQGGTLRLVMGPTPNNSWGSRRDDLPPAVK
ncbi:MAG: GH92 family glycosyl hydrolase [Prevotella sp.]